MMSDRSPDRQLSATRVVVVDDQTMMQELMKEYVSIADDIQVVGVAGNGREGVHQILDLEPDVVLMDIEMPDMDGITATQILKNRKSLAKVLVVSSSYDDRYLAQSLRNGAMGYLLKTTTPEELVAAIRGVQSGSLQFGSGILQQKLSSMTPGARARKQTLTSKQIETKKRTVTPLQIDRTSSRSVIAEKDSSVTRPLTSISNRRHAKQQERFSNVTVDVDAASNGTASRRVKNTKSQTEMRLEQLAIELSQIRAGYWVLRTEIQNQRQWLNTLVAGLVVSIAVCGLLVLL